MRLRNYSLLRAFKDSCHVLDKIVAISVNFKRNWKRYNDKVGIDINIEYKKLIKYPRSYNGADCWQLNQTCR